jgi:membrane associated rhomboid family serine protease
MADSASPDGEAVLQAASRRAAEAAALVLAAEGIPHRIANDDGRFSLRLAAEDRARAEQALATYARENAPETRPPAEPAAAVDTWAGLWLALALIGIYAQTGGWDEASAFFARGANDGRAVLAGEWWRPITALTLHADVSHVFGNAFSCAVFATLLMRRYGAGVGLVLLLLSGTLGNAAAAAWSRAHYHSVGASTALFGAIGILAATELVRRRRLRIRLAQSWLPIAGGLGLLAMLGTGRGSDLTAHLFGFLSGIATGVGAARLFRKPPPPPVQLALGAAACALVAWAWRAAFAGQ